MRLAQCVFQESKLCFGTNLEPRAVRVLARFSVEKMGAVDPRSETFMTSRQTNWPAGGDGMSHPAASLITGVVAAQTGSDKYCDGDSLAEMA